jgi:hypothetical protein
LATQQKAETLKAEIRGRKATACGIEKQQREEQEDGEGKKQPLTAAPFALRFPLSRPP